MLVKSTPDILTKKDAQKIVAAIFLLTLPGVLAIFSLIVFKYRVVSHGTS